MAKENHTIVGVHITDRLQDAVKVQMLLTEYGDQIKTRLGLHELQGPGKNGLLLLEMVPPKGRIQELCDKLNAIEGVDVQTMVFAH